MNEGAVKIFDCTTIDKLSWPNTENGRLAKKIILPFIKRGPDFYIDNIQTEMKALLIDDVVLPLTQNNTNEKNAYVCSPYTHYVRYAFSELDLLPNKLLKTVGRAAVKILGKILKWGEVDKILFVNNWLLPTNLYPTLSGKQIQKITEALLDQYPEHVIAFRSVNTISPPGFVNHLQQDGYDLVLSRMIYYTDTRSSEPFKSRMFKSDKKLVEKSPYHVIADKDITPANYPRIQKLYAELNLEKYFQWNPQFNEHFIELVRESQAFNFTALEQQNRVDAISGSYTLNGVMNSPLFGYDTTLPQEFGLYRQIATHLLLEAKGKGLLLHQSAGGGNYKKLRRAQSTIEYTAVYTRHLPLKRRIPWKILRLVMNNIGKWILERYQI